MEGTYLENKGTMLTFHFRNVPELQIPDLQNKVKEIILSAGFKIGNAHFAVEGKPKVQWNKGKASIFILKNAFGTKWDDKLKIIYVGDDQTDEDAMKALKGLAVSFRVTQSNLTQTSADMRLPSTKSVLSMLQWVEGFLNARHSSNPPDEIDLQICKNSATSSS